MVYEFEDGRGVAEDDVEVDEEDKAGWLGE